MWLLAPLFATHAFHSGYEASVYRRLAESRIISGIAILCNSFGHMMGAIAIAVCVDGYFLWFCSPYSLDKVEEAVEPSSRSGDSEIPDIPPRRVRFIESEMIPNQGSIQSEKKRPSLTSRDQLRQSLSCPNDGGIHGHSYHVMRCGACGVILLVITRVAWLSCQCFFGMD